MDHNRIRMLYNYSNVWYGCQCFFRFSKGRSAGEAILSRRFLTEQPAGEEVHLTADKVRVSRDIVVEPGQKDKIKVLVCPLQGVNQAHGLGMGTLSSSIPQASRSFPSRLGARAVLSPLR